MYVRDCQQLPSQLVGCSLWSGLLQLLPKKNDVSNTKVTSTCVGLLSFLVEHTYFSHHPSLNQEFFSYFLYLPLHIFIAFIMVYFRRYSAGKWVSKPPRNRLPSNAKIRKLRQQTFLQRETTLRKAIALIRTGIKSDPSKTVVATQDADDAVKHLLSLLSVESLDHSIRLDKAIEYDHVFRNRYVLSTPCSETFDL